MVARRFGYVQYKPNRREPKRIIASFVTPPDFFERWPDLPQRISKTFRPDQEAEATAWLRRQQLLVEADSWQPESEIARQKASNTITFGQYWDEWLPARRTRGGKPLEAGTRYRMERDAGNHILPYFGNVKLASIDHAMVERWLEQLPSDQPAMRANALKLLKAVLRSASQPGPHGQRPLIATMPYTDPIDRPRTEHQVEPATPEQVHAIYDAMPERYRLAVYLAVFCRGLRIGEVCALQVRHVDLEHRILHVRQSRKTMGDDAIGAPKTAASVRDERIPDQLVPLIQTHIDSLPDRSPDGWMFPAVQDPLKPVHPNTMRRAYAQARTAARRPDLRFHDLRHTALTWLAQDGATLRELMDSAGHSTTENAMRYQHMAQGRDAQLADALGGRLMDDTADGLRTQIRVVDERIRELQSQRDELERRLRKL